MSPWTELLGFLYSRIFFSTFSTRSCGINTFSTPGFDIGISSFASGQAILVILVKCSANSLAKSAGSLSGSKSAIDYNVGASSSITLVKMLYQEELRPDCFSLFVSLSK